MPAAESDIKQIERNIKLHRNDAGSAREAMVKASSVTDGQATINHYLGTSHIACPGLGKAKRSMGDLFRSTIAVRR